MQKLRLKRVADIHAYIALHTQRLGYPPTAIGLDYQDYLNILAEIGADGRCNNITAVCGGIRLVRL